ncbi:MAG: hypothetical protein ACO4CG_02355, partial [Prochlorothrix sp.]
MPRREVSHSQWVFVGSGTIDGRSRPIDCREMGDIGAKGVSEHRSIAIRGVPPQPCPPGIPPSNAVKNLLNTACYWIFWLWNLMFLSWAYLL